MINLGEVIVDWCGNVRRASFKWFEGYIVVYLEGDELVVEGSNSKIKLSPREVVVKGLFQGVREYLEGARGERKTVYIDLAFPLKGLSKPWEIAFARHIDTYINNYGISYTVIEGVGHYLTIYPPPGSLYEHAVIAEDSIALLTLSRRKVYLVEEDNARRVILV